jgi:hypothetical protein
VLGRSHKSYLHGPAKTIKDHQRTRHLLGLTKYPCKNGFLDVNKNWLVYDLFPRKIEQTINKKLYQKIFNLPEDPTFSTGSRLIFKCRYLCILVSTVMLMILSRYRYRPVTVPLPSRYRPVTVPLPFLGLRYRPLPILDQRYPRLPCVTDRPPTLPNVTSVTER